MPESKPKIIGLDDAISSVYSAKFVLYCRVNTSRSFMHVPWPWQNDSYLLHYLFNFSGSQMITSIPKRIDEVSAPWLSSILETQVKDFNTTLVAGGHLADVFRIQDIIYADSGSLLPTSLIIKIACQHEGQRAIATSNNAYLREVLFFEQLAAEVPLRTPTIYTVQYDNPERCEYFCIIMEDLSSHSTLFDQSTGQLTEADIRKINLELAEFHALFWESDTLTLDWLGFPEDHYEFPMHEAALGCEDSMDTFVALWENAFKQSPFNEKWSSLEPMTRLICDGNAQRLLDQIYKILKQRPRTLLHNDLRGNNLFRTKPQLGESSEVTYIDWQLVAPGPPGLEFSEAWQHSVPPEIRRKDVDFLKQYHQRLTEIEPKTAAYTYQMLLEDYRLGYILWWMTLINLGTEVLKPLDTPEGSKAKALWGTNMPFMYQAIEDHDCYGMVKRLLSPTP